MTIIKPLHRVNAPTPSLFSTSVTFQRRPPSACLPHARPFLYLPGLMLGHHLQALCCCTASLSCNTIVSLLATCRSASARLNLRSHARVLNSVLKQLLPPFIRAMPPAEAVGANAWRSWLIETGAPRHNENAFLGTCVPSRARPMVVKGVVRVAHDLATLFGKCVHVQFRMPRAVQLSRSRRARPGDVCAEFSRWASHVGRTAASRDIRNGREL